MPRAKTAHAKRELVDRLISIWTANPDLRLGQLISNSLEGKTLAQRDQYLFYTEDTELIEGIERVYGGDH